MDDLQAVIIITILSYLIEFLNINLDISLLNLILFINMIGIYIIIKKINGIQNQKIKSGMKKNKKERKTVDKLMVVVGSYPDRGYI